MIRLPLLLRVSWFLRGYPGRQVLRFLEESQWHTPEQLAALRDRKLAGLIEHAYENVPYWREEMDERSLKPSDITKAADLPKLPVLTKDILRREKARMWDPAMPKRKIRVSTTGGTTGEPMTVRRGLSDGAWSVQCFSRGLSWGGLTPAMPRVSLFGGSLGQGPSGSWAKRSFKRWAHGRKHFLPAFELGRGNVAEYMARIRESGCRHMIGYTSALHHLAQYAEEAGLSADLEAVFPTAEVLPENWKDQIARVFRCKVLPFYGCGECNSLGFQCGEAEGYHRCDEHAILEAERDGGAFLEGEGAFLVTDLDNRAMPIIRYRNGDAGVLSDEPCPCGRGLGRILRIDGRINDQLLACNGDAISGALAPHAFRLVRGVDLYQFVQDRPGQVLIRIVANERYNRDREENRVSDIVRAHLGEEADVAFEYPEDIERTPAGKARFVLNRADPSEPAAAP